MMMFSCCNSVSLLLVVLLLVVVASAPPAAAMDAAKGTNMNGAPGQYKIANAAATSSSSSSTGYSTDYQAEFFEVYSPLIRSRYAEVFWTGLPPVPLPTEIIERFAAAAPTKNNGTGTVAKTMAVIGYEVDQVKKHGDGDGDISVPITHAYNHHYCSWLVNAQKARLVQTKAPEEMVRLGMTHGSEDHWVTEFLTDNDSDGSETPLVQFFSEGNGGEFRLSYHGYPTGYAQLIQGPTEFHITPMQIDTWNRDEPSPKFQPGPLPRNSQIPPSAGYSGLLECPCNDQTHKEWAMTYQLEQEQKKSWSCNQPIQNATECWNSVPQVTRASRFRQHIIHTEDAAYYPPGCSLVQHRDGIMDIFWNNHNHNHSQHHDEERIIAQEAAETADEFLVLDQANSKKDDDDTVAFAAGQINVTVAIINDNDNDNKQDAVTITLVGPSDRWFGVGFGSDTMCLHQQSDQCPDGGPYAIIVLEDHVQERKLGYHGPGTVLSNRSSSITVQSDETNAHGNRTIVLTRAREGATSSHYTFEEHPVSVPIIMARGCGMEFAQHCGHGPAQLDFLTAEAPAVVCRAGVQGTINGRKFNQVDRCPSFPRGDIKEQHNPTCTIETYRGGLYCCNHGQSLLDSDQENPWQDQFLEYHLKFRFYFEEYRPATADKELAIGNSVQTAKASHKNLVRLYWTTEGRAGEYDIIPCRNNTPPSQCIQVIQSRFKVQDMLHDCATHKDASWCTGVGSTDPTKTKGVELIYAGPHCHAPSCLSMELYNANTGQLLCRAEPIYGQSENKVYDEHGFLAIPPCLWGDSSEGLAPPVLLPLDTELLSIKRNNNTLPHTGEMASWQMRGVVIPRDEPTEDDAVEQSAVATHRLRREG